MFLQKILRNRLKYIACILIALFVIAVFINNSTTVLKLIYPVKYKEQVYKYSVQYNLDPNLVFAIIKAESGFDSKATSRKNARGLMQITDGTGEWGAQSLQLGSYQNLNLYDPETNINIGCWYLGKLMKEFNYDLETVIAAYNGGSGNVTEWLKDSSISGKDGKLVNIPFKETERYLDRVKHYYSVYKSIYKK